MNKILISLGILVLVGCAVGLVFSFQALGKAEDKLEKTQEDVTSLQIELQDTRSDLTDTEDELQDTAAKLTDTQNSLEEQLNETAKYINMYEGARAELENTEDELGTLMGLLDSTQQANDELQEEFDEIQEKLDLYENTLGTTVYSNRASIAVAFGFARLTHMSSRRLITTT